MRRILRFIAVSGLLNDAIGWISQPDTFHRRSSLSFQSPMAPMEFIDVEVTGHAKESSNNTKREAKIKDEDKARTKDILMPSISPMMTKGKIVEWLVRTGDTIRKGDPIMVIESEKESQGSRGYRMNQDVHANVDGVLAAIYQQPGQAVNVGAVLGVIVPDYIIDVEVEGQPVPKPEEETAKDEPTVTTTPIDASAEMPWQNVAEASPKTPSKTSRPSSMMDEIMPNTQNFQSVNPIPSGAAGGASDWVHQHHATTDGMVNDSSFYTSHQTQSSSVGGGPRKGRFDIGIDNMDPFYSPYGEAGPSGHIPPPPRPPYAAQPGPSMQPNGANDRFYEAYQGDKRPNDLYAQKQTNPWGQSIGNVGNANMGDYYRADQNINGPSNPVNASPFNPPPASARPDPIGGYTGYDIPTSPKVVDNFVKGVSPSEVDPQDGYSSQFVQPTTSSSSVKSEPFVGSSSSSTTATTTATPNTPSWAPIAPPSPVVETRTPAPVVETPTPSAPQVVPPPIIETPVFDQAQVDVMESRIASLEEFLRATGSTHGQQQHQHHQQQDLLLFQTTIQAELDNLKKEVANVRVTYDDKVKALEESYQTSLSQVGREFSTNMEELRDWDTLTVTWDIKDFEKTLQIDLTTYTSEEFNVAGYSMTLEMQIFGTNEERTRDVGFYIMHTGGLNYVPIMIGGSKIVIQSTTGNDDAIKVFVDDASIEDSHYGWGWKKFFSLQDLKESFVNTKGEIQVIASVRVKRVKNCRINTAI